MANERETKDLVRSHFKEDPLCSTVRLEEQRSRVSTLKEWEL